MTAEDVEQRRPGDTTLFELVGDHPKSRILLAMATNADRSWNVTDIARLADTDRATIYRHRDDLLKSGLIVRTGKRGNSPMYRFDPDNRAAAAFAHLKREVRA